MTVTLEDAILGLIDRAEAIDLVEEIDTSAPVLVQVGPGEWSWNIKSIVTNGPDGKPRSPALTEQIALHAERKRQVLRRALLDYRAAVQAESASTT